MNDGMLSIGALARAGLLSVKALRAYHAAGILVASRVDVRTGDRSYATSDPSAFLTELAWPIQPETETSP